jgi:tetratricopeptide (TPR) repeat protein
MLHRNNIIALFFAFILQGCAWFGFIDSNDYQTVASQGFELQKMARMGPAEERYKKALRLAEASGDSRTIAHARYNLGLLYRHPRAYDAKKSVHYLEKSLRFYANDNAASITTDMYIALTEVYGKEGNNKLACNNLKKAQQTYIQKIVSNSDYAPQGAGYKNFLNPVRRDHPFKKFDELVDYYNQQLACGL